MTPPGLSDAEMLAPGSAVRRGWSVAVVVMYLLAAVGVGIMTWGARRGLDFIDGGYYYLTYLWPADVADLHTSFQLVGRLVFLAVGKNVVAFRLASALAVIAAAVVFCLGFRHHLRRVFPSCPAAGWLLPSFMIASFTLFAILLLASAGLLFSAVSDLAVPGTHSVVIGSIKLAGACLLAGFDLLVKPSTSLLLMGAIAGFCALTPLLALRTKLKLVAVAGVSLVLGLLLFLPVLGHWSAMVLRLHNLLGLMENSSYTEALRGRVRGEVTDLLRLAWGDFRWPLAACAALAALLALFRRGGTPSRRLAAAAGTVLLGSWLWTIARIPAWRAAQLFFADAAVTRFFLFTILLLSCCVLASHLLGCRPKPGLDRRSPSHLVLVLTMLTLLPFAGAFGTTNPLYLTAAYHAPCWLAVAVALLLILERQWQTSLVLPLVLPLLAGVGLAQYVNGAVLHPYALRTDLFAQDTPTPVGSPPTTLLLDADTGHFITETRRILTSHGFTPGDDVFAFFNLPGLVFAVGGRSPVVPWYFGRIYVGNDIEASYMQAAGAERRRTAWIITQDDVTRFRDHFHAGGIDFPEGYEAIGTLTNPTTALTVKIWRPRGHVD
jgi:hypothetical protein